MITSGTGRIFISYRRADSAPWAGRIYDRISAHFGKDAVFMDVDTIEAGLDFVEVLQHAVQSCDVLVALIGRRWLESKDTDGKWRLDNPEDFVRIEIAAALERDIRVIPVLVDGVLMPRSTDLPENLKPFARRNALQVDHHSFNADARRLISQLELALKAAEDSRILKAQRLQEEKEQNEKEAAAQAAREKVEREILEKARIEKEAREKAEAEERERKVAEEQKYIHEREKLEQQIFLEKLRKEKEERKRKVASDELPGGIGKIEKFNRNSLLTSGGIILILICLIIGGPAVYRAVFPQPVPEPTDFPRPVSTPTDLSDELGVGSTMNSEKDGMAMVYVPAGEFQMGSENGDSDEKPVHTVNLDAFWIDQTEVTNAMYAKCVDAGECDPPSSTSSYTYEGYYESPFFDVFPVVYVSWSDAVAYCEWVGSRLPTEAEWEKAAGWDDDTQSHRVYPWGDTIDDSYANYNSNVGDTNPVHSFIKAKNFYGAYDMAGNVWEWVADWYDVYPGGDKNASQDFGQTYKVLRGGSWNSDVYLVRSANRGRFNPADADFNVGFRCSRSP